MSRSTPTKTRRANTGSSRSTGSDGPCASRWTAEELEWAATIGNDINKEIDNGETREDLRKALLIYGDMLYDAMMQVSLLKTEALLQSLDQNVEAMRRERRQPLAVACADLFDRLSLGYPS